MQTENKIATDFTLLNKKVLVKYFISLISRIACSNNNNNTISRLIYIFLSSLVKFLILVLHKIKK